MRVAVLGLWHLGAVTAAACASLGHDVIALDENADVVRDCNSGRAPVSEPGLDELIADMLSAGRLRFDQPAEHLFKALQVLWVTYDTPVDDDDKADVEFVIDHVTAVLPWLPVGCVVLLSSQLPVGSAMRLRNAAKRANLRIDIAVSPENLRLGKALGVFLKPDRIVMGYEGQHSREVLGHLVAPLNAPVEWMSCESAEMSKHAINAFLALSVTFANELASVCEKYGADAKAVERSLKTESRIGPQAYLAPGSAFAGGTLARDISYLNMLAADAGLDLPLLAAVTPSNRVHRNWEKRKLQSVLKQLGGARVGVWGLTYKPGTDTLRRSSAVELIDWLMAEGATILVHDPAVPALPDRWRQAVHRCHEPDECIQTADALVVCTAWPIYREKGSQLLVEHTLSRSGLLVLDAGRVLADAALLPGIRYHAVGTPEMQKAIA